jgi:hypothetical protein
MSVKELPLANVFGRVAALGTAYGIGVQGLLDRLVSMAPELSELAVVNVTSGFDRLSVATEVARAGDAMDRVRGISDACDRDQFERMGALVKGETRSVYIECESVPGSDGVGVTLQAFGNRALAVDLERLASVGVSPAAIAALGTTARQLGGDEHLVGLSDRATPGGEATWTLHIAQPNKDAARRSATRDRVIRTATDLAVTKPQQNVVESLHDVLVHDDDSYTYVSTSRTQRSAELGVVWANVPWEHVVRMMIQFYPTNDCPKHVGELAGAFGTDHAAAIELVLRQSEPPGMRVAASLIRGRSQS